MTRLTSIACRPCFTCFSIPLHHQPYQGDDVYNFFDNLLPDNPDIRRRIVVKHHADSTRLFVCWLNWRCDC
ncbi:HipA N-terminal domain-containing protein [Symbiopectobacterium sp. Eva_TO]